MNKLIFLIAVISLISCNQSTKNTPSTKDQINELVTLFYSRGLNLTIQENSAPNEIKMEITTLTRKAKDLGNNAIELNKNKSLQYKNRYPFKKLNNKELLDSLESIQLEQDRYIKKAVELEIAYNCKMNSK